MDSFVELYQAANAAEANAIKQRLQRLNIPVRLLGEALGGTAGALPTYSQSTRVLVEQCQHGLAMEQLQRYLQTIVPWQCECGEMNDGSWGICQRCGRAALS
ncbi:MAG: DUF2007 domain-containing protein [Ferrimonas sp.]